MTRPANAGMHSIADADLSYTVRQFRALRAALKWRATNPAAPWSVMFHDALRKQDSAGRVAAMRLDALADVLFDLAMSPAAARQFAEDARFQEENQPDE